MASKFIHLHLHTEYSLLDGLTKISKLTKKIKEMGMDSVALSDHGAMYGAIEFYKACKKEELKPIVGMEAYTCIEDHKLRPEKTKETNTTFDRKNNHLLLLAKDEEGYKNLMKITSIAHTEGYYYRPRIQRELLAKYSKGLICTSACPAGELAQQILNDDYDGAKKVAKWFLDVFGEDYYLEVQRHGYENVIASATDPEIKAEMTKMVGIEKKMNETVLRLSKDLGIPIVATNDSHYLNKEDAEAQDVLVCVATGKQVAEKKRIRFIDNPNYYVKTAEEMEEIFADMPEAISNTVKAAEKCNLEISTFGKWFFPKFPVPDNKKPEDYFTELVYQKLPEKITEVTDKVKARLELELGIINQKGYAPYFLIVNEMVEWANEKGIVTNTRGSAAGSLVSFVLGITTVNPLTYYLPFERFLNIDRPTPPDIDFDVSDDRREDIINYMCEKYGKESVAQICTFGRMLARASARDIARVLGYPYIVGDKISKQIPPPKQGFPVNVEKALATNPVLKDMYDHDPDSRKILNLAKQVEGSARHLSVHAAGVVVAQSVLTDFTPIQNDKPGSDKIVTQYEMHAAEDVGLIKFDILGIRNLAILGAAIDIVEKERGNRVDLHKIPLDDTKTFEMLSRGETMGVFQMGGGGMTKWIKELKPTRVEDLMAMVALYRPGPMAVIPDYIARKNNPELVKYEDPRMEKFLGASYGLLVYQDDLLFCVLDMAGYTWTEADKFRKAVGKKIPEEMAAQKDKFINGIITNGQTAEFAEHLWTLFEPFQSYGFNKAHAASYGMVSYQTAYMKANYPVEYMTALLTAESGDTEKISQAIGECRRMNIKVLAPDINESNIGFNIVKDPDSLDGKAIRFGLSAIKNVGHAAIEAIMEVRDKGKFVSLADFCSRVDGRRVNKKVLESLTKVGALSIFGNRASVLASLDEIRSKVKPKQENGQQDLFAVEEKENQEKELITVQEVLSTLPEFSDEEIQNLERELLGLSLSAKPIIDLLGELGMHTTHHIHDLVTEDEGFEHPREREIVKIAGIVTEARTVLTKTTSSQMAFVKIDDGTGVISLVVFPKIFEKTKDLWVDAKPVLISGKIDKREDTASILVETVDTHESIKNRKDTLYIKIPGGVQMESLKKLKELLMQSPGDQEVVLVFEGRKESVKLGFKIAWSEDLSHMISVVLDLQVS